MNQKQSKECPRPCLMAEDIQRIYLDLDGVLADFFGFTRQVLGTDYRSIPPALAWKRLATVPRLYAQLELLNGASELYQTLAQTGRPLAVLSATPLPSGELVSAPRDKRAWVARNLAPCVQVITVCGWENKALFAAPGALLIDDSERNVQHWEAAGGIGICHENSEKTLSRLTSMAARYAAFPRSGEISG